MTEEEKKEYEKLKISVPLYTYQELEEFENILENDFKSVFDKVTEHVYKERECIALQMIIKKQQAKIEQLKEDMSNMYDEKVVRNILENICNLSKDEIDEILY